MIAFTIFAASCFQKAERINPTITSSETPVPPATKISDTTFEAFSHKVPEHKQFECNSCHQREGGSLKMEFAGHDSCIGCHLNQFTNPQRSMCAICHEDLQSVPPSKRKFPTKFREGFNMKFDHAIHARECSSGRGLCFMPFAVWSGKINPGRFQCTFKLLHMPHG